MRTAWKGLVVGGALGLLAGALIELRGARSGRPRRRASGPLAVGRLKAAAAQSGALLHQPAVQDGVRKVAHGLSDAASSDQVKSAVTKAVAKGREVAASVQDADIPAQARNVVRAVADQTEPAASNGAG